MTPAKVLVIDDDQAGCRVVRAIVTAHGLGTVVAAHDGEAGLETIETEKPDVVVLDLGLPRLDGMEVLGRLRATHPDLPVIVLTADNQIRTAVKATEQGAFHFLTKPIDGDELAVVVLRALESRALRAQVDDLRRRLEEGGALARLLGPSPEARHVVEQVRTVAATNFTVLVVGETGTGKDLVAEAIHRDSERRDKPFLALDCGALEDAFLDSTLFGADKERRRPAGRGRLAEGGTLFLDEVSNMTSSVQARLLRALESRQPAGAPAAPSTRYIAASSRDLQALVTAGSFGADLYFRLAQYTIRLPPLRERPVDIPHLAARFLEEASFELRRPMQQIPDDAVALLRRHPWPGNVRELRNVIRQAVLESKDQVLRAELVNAVLGKAAATGSSSVMETAALDGRSLREIAADAARAAERDAITSALKAANGNKSVAAKALRTDYKTLHVKMKSLGIRARDFSA